MPGNRGRIRRVRLQDIELLDGTVPKSVVIGFGEPGGVEEISIAGLRHNGQELKDAAAARLEAQSAQAVRFEDFGP